MKLSKEQLDALERISKSADGKVLYEVLEMCQFELRDIDNLGEVTAEEKNKTADDILTGRRLAIYYIKEMMRTMNLLKERDNKRVKKELYI